MFIVQVLQMNQNSKMITYSPDGRYGRFGRCDRTTTTATAIAITACES